MAQEASNAMSNTRRDLDKEISTAVSLVAAARTATANGTGVDLANFDAAVAVVSAGVITDGTHTLKLQDSDDNSTFADVDSSLLSGSFTALTSGAGGSTTQEVGYLGTKRYVRAVTTASGSPSTGGVFALTIVRGRSRTLPV